MPAIHPPRSRQLSRGFRNATTATIEIDDDDLAYGE
jgi:hypothetical protein